MYALRGWVALGVIAGLSGLCHPIDAQRLPPADTVWRYTAPSNIAYLRECPDAELLLTTKDALIAVDASTGAPLWTMERLPHLGSGLSLGRCGAATGFSYRRDKIVAFDLLSGRQLWDASALSQFREIRGYFRLDDDDLLLLFLRTATSEHSLHAIRLSSGTTLWQRDDLFAQQPKFAGNDGVSDISEFQSLYKDTDTTLLLYVSADGPTRLDARTGATLWRGEMLAGRRVPAVGDYAPMVMVDSILVIPRDNGLVALDTRDGHQLWETTTDFPVRPTRLVGIAGGVLVRAGRAYLTMLDPATGAERWAAPLRVETDGVAYELVEDLYYVVSKGRLLVADLATGDTTALATVEFDGGENAQALYAMDDGLLIAARQNLSRCDFQGTLRYHRYFKAPGASVLEKVSGVMSGTLSMFGARFGSAEFRSQYAYFVTDAPDSTGQTGRSIVRVALDDGRDAGRIWFEERSPTYTPDTARDQLLYRESDKTIVALRFPEEPNP